MNNIIINIPFVIICWNNLTFVKSFINQLKKYPNRIILLDNFSTFKPLKEYYREIKKELGNKIDIRLLNDNYGHTVYLKLSNTLPTMYFLSDPDLELNKNLPNNFTEILYSISMHFNAYKVGFALDISDHDKFYQNNDYEINLSIYDWEKQFWQKKIIDEKYKDYELYDANVDTTFCLVNINRFKKQRIRIAGDFTAKHLPWYKDYIKNNFSEDELEHWKKNNKSSSILRYI
jgi:hypothetical protein